MCLVAILRPTSVLPAPGTPVTKQIALCEDALAFSIIFEIASDVRVKLMALASFRDISATECPLYNELAASMIVGVGQYRPVSPSRATITVPSIDSSTCLNTWPRSSRLVFIGRKTPSWYAVVENG